MPLVLGKPLFLKRNSLLPGWWGKMSTPLNQRVLADAISVQCPAWRLASDRGRAIPPHLLPRWPAWEVNVSNAWKDWRATRRSSRRLAISWLFHCLAASPHEGLTTFPCLPVSLSKKTVLLVLVLGSWNRAGLQVPTKRHLKVTWCWTGHWGSPV